MATATNSSNNFILITGAGGFIGQALASALLAESKQTHLVLADVFSPPTLDQHRTVSIKADLTLSNAVESLLGSHKWAACYLLHGLMSGGAESNLDLGLAVNIDSHRLILDHLRRNQSGVTVVFPSSLAIYGPPQSAGDVISERTIPLPQSSYGAEKLIVETLINDYSRRGLIDGRVCRLPTIIVRPGVPSAAASSFASGIVREPLSGKTAILPVSKHLEMWICSPRTVVRNLLNIRHVPKEKFREGKGRTVNLPGQTVTVGQILDALKEVGGQKALDLVEENRDPRIEAIVASWPARFDVKFANSLGMVQDITLSEEVERFAAQAQVPP